jgi:hypothetical protein
MLETRYSKKIRHPSSPKRVVIRTYTGTEMKEMTRYRPRSKPKPGNDANNKSLPTPCTRPLQIREQNEKEKEKRIQSSPSTDARSKPDLPFHYGSRSWTECRRPWHWTLNWPYRREDSFHNPSPADVSGISYVSKDPTIIPYIRLTFNASFREKLLSQ